MAVASALSPMYRRSRRRASTSSMVAGPTALTCKRLPPAEAELVVGRVVGCRAVRVLARVVRPWGRLDAAADGELLTVGTVGLDRRFAAAERALVARGQDERDRRRRRRAVEAARVLDIGRQDARVTARSLADLLLMDGVDLVARRPGGGVVEIEDVGRRRECEVLVVVRELHVEVRDALDALAVGGPQPDEVVGRVLGDVQDEVAQRELSRGLAVDDDVVGSLGRDVAEEVGLYLVGFCDLAGVEGLGLLGRVPAITHDLRQLLTLGRIRDLTLQKCRALEVDLAVDLQRFVAERAL